MLWLVAGLLACAAVAIRLGTLHGRPQVWWLAFTGALLGIVAGSALLIDEAAVNQALRVPNVAYLLSNLAFVLAGGSVTIFVHTLRRKNPSPPAMAAHAAGAVAVGVVIGVGWWFAPVHDVEYPRFRQVPPNPQEWAYDWVFHLYFIPVLVNVVANSFQLARKTRADDPARRFGLVLTGCACLLDVLAHLLYLIRLAVRPRNPVLALQAGTVADLLTLIAVLGIAAGAIAFLAVPQLLVVLRAWHLVARLRPLWVRTREMHPSVALPRPRLIRYSPALQAERMITEITDGLRLLALPPNAADTDDPYVVIADALRSPASLGGPPASSRLPTPASRLEEEEQVLHLARCYGGLSRAR